MNNTYLYRKHLRHMPKVIIAMIIITLILIIISLMYLPFMAFIFFVFLVYDILILIFMRRFSTSSFVVTDDYIHFINNSKEIKWTYAEILILDSKSIKNTGGWLNIIPKEGKTLKVTVVLEDIAEFVRDIKTRLDNNDMSDKYNEEKLFKFYKTAAYSDDSWRRMYFFAPIFALITLIQVIVAIITTATIKTDIMINPIFITIIVTMILYLIIELGVFAKKVGKETDSTNWNLPEIDIAYEKNKMKIPLFIQGVLFLLSFLLLL